MSVDSRIVTMKFDNRQFEQAAGQTLSTMDKLKASMNFKGAEKGFSDLQGSADKFNLKSMDGAVNTVSASFSAMSVVAITALANITTKAIDAGTQLVKSLTLDPVMQGFAEYELKMGSIQTIMAGSGESLDVVNQKLQELNEYADKTIYSFADMTTNIGKFTNAGVELDVAVEAIQGVANVAAVSGANSEEASRAMYNFAQAISTGTVRLQDWKSIELANMGTVEFKDQLIDSAIAAGMLTEGVDGVARSLKGTEVTATNFNSTLQEQWLTSEVLIDTLQRYSDSTTDIGKKAEAAATQVKTFSHLLDTLREGAGSGWATTFEIIFGNFNEAVELWTKVNDVIGGMIGRAADARNLKLTDWKALGGRSVLIEGIGNAFNALITIFERVSAAWDTIFPEKTGMDLYTLTKQFEFFTQSLIMSEETAQHFQDTLEGVFAVFGIIWEVIKGVVGVIFDLIGATTGAAGGFLSITGTIGNFLVSIHEALKAGTLLTDFFDFLGQVLALPIQLIGILADFVGSLFSKFDQGAADSATDSLSETTSILGGLTEALGTMVEWLGSIFDKLATLLGPAAEKIGELFGSLWDNLVENIGTGDLLGGIGAALAGGGAFKLGSGIKNFFDNMGEIGPVGFLDELKTALGELTGILTAMQNNIRADTLLKIASAVGILAVALSLLSTIDPSKLAAATAGMTAMFLELMAALKIMELITRAKSIWKMPVIAASLILLASALLVLSAAVKSMASLSWSELLRGLVGIAVGIGILLVAIQPLAKNSKGMFKAATSIVVLSTALWVMAQAVQAMGELSMATIAKGLGGIAGGLVIISVAMQMMPKNMMWTALALTSVSTALNILAASVKIFGSMNWGELARGLIGLAGGLVIIAQAFKLMPNNIERVALALILVGGAINLIAIAMKQLGKMGWEEMARGMIMLAGSLGILAAGLHLMKGTLAGSAALLVASAALAVLVPVLIALGILPWQVIVTSLIALAGVFTVLGVAGLLLGPIVPLILALAGAVGLLGIGLLAAGAGVLAFASALAILVGLGSAAALVMKEMLDAIVGSIPGALKAFGEGIVAFAGAIAQGGPQFVAAMTTILNSMLQAIIDTMPKFREAMTEVVKTLIAVMVEHIPDLAAAGLDMLLAVLNEILRNAYRMVSVGLQILTQFLKGIADNIGDVIDAAFDVVIAFIDGLADAIDEHTDEIIESAKKLGKAVITGIAKGMADLTPIGRAVSAITSKIKGDAADQLEVSSPSKVFERIGQYIVEGLAVGLSDPSRVEGATGNLGQAAIDGIKRILSQLNESIDGEIELRPTITPVLDLTEFRKAATTMGKGLPANVSYNQASGISSAYQTAQGAGTAESTATGASVIRFEQNNYSPKALSSVEIYRQTKNQLSLAKEALTA